MAWLIYNCGAWTCDAKFLMGKVFMACCNTCHGVGHGGLSARYIGLIQYTVCCRIAGICLKVARDVNI